MPWVRRLTFTRAAHLIRPVAALNPLVIDQALRLAVLSVWNTPLTVGVSDRTL